MIPHLKFSDNIFIMVSFAFTFLQLVYMKKFQWETIKLVKSKCLAGQTMACFGGKYRRNVFTFEEIVGYKTRLLLFTLIYNIMIVLFQFYCDSDNSHIYFVVHNIFYVSFVNIYFLVYVPLKHVLLSNQSIWYSTKSKDQDTPRSFYVRNPVLQMTRNLNQPKQAVEQFSFDMPPMGEDQRFGMSAVEI